MASQSHDSINSQSVQRTEGDEATGNDSDVDTTPGIQFNDFGNIIGGYKKFSKRSLALLKTSVSVTYGHWADIPVEIIDDIWETLQKEFQIPDSLKKSVCKKFAEQIKSWKKRLRKKHFDQYNSAQIASLIDSNPKSIQQDAWNAFIKREASATKILEREQAAQNRACKTDVHVSGARSYAQIYEILARSGIKPSRADLYKYCRRRQDGTFHPAVAALMENLSNIQTEQGDMNVSLDRDALTQLFGPDNRGRTRGIGSRVSKTQALAVEQLHAIQEMKKTKKKEKQKKMKSFEKRLEDVEAVITSFSSKQSSSNTNQPSTLPSQSPSQSQLQPSLCAPSSPQVTSFCKYKIRSLIEYARFIGQGRGSSEPTPGAVVHHRPMLPIERKISVDLVYEEMHSELLYLGRQGCCNTFGEVEGGFVVWPEYLLEKIKE